MRPAKYSRDVGLCPLIPRLDKKRRSVEVNLVVQKSA